jgi:DUF177 domain-containing protein
MQSILPEQLDVIQKAKFGAEIEGTWPINKLQRFSELLLDDAGDLQAELKFQKLGHLRLIDGNITAELKVACQRCMQPMDLPLNIDFKLGLICKEAQAEGLPEGYEPYLIEGDSENIPHMLEEELLLAMPLVAMHEHDCSDYLQQQRKRQQDEAEQQEEEKENPFSQLKDLL